MHCSIVSGKSMPWQTLNKGQRRIFITSSLPFPNAWLKPGCRGPEAPSPLFFLLLFFFLLPLCTDLETHFESSVYWSHYWSQGLNAGLLWASAPRLYKQAQCTVLSPLSHCLTVMYRLFFFFSPPPHTHKYKSIFSAKLRRICLHNEACPFLSGRTRKQWQKPHKVNEREWEIPPVFFNHQRVYEITPFSPLFHEYSAT